MAFRGTVTGNLGQDPDMRFTQAGKSALALSVAATASRKDPQTGQWSDDGDPLWVRVTLWERDAERWADLLHKGDRVSVEGTLVLRSFTRQDGSQGLSYELSGARMLGYAPKNPPSGTQRPDQRSTHTDPYQGGQQAAWGAPGSGDAPF